MDREDAQHATRRGTVGVLLHHGLETPGLIGEALEAAGLAADIRHVYRGEAVPVRPEAEWGGLVLMGGPQSVYEQDRHPRLRDELRLLESALGAGLPVLGVCLGSQLLAAALGARVYAGARPEVGWLPVTRLPAATDDVVFSGLPDVFAPLHWHGDVFDLPAGAVALAASAATPVQAFRSGPCAYGLLFHLEVTARHVADWVRAFDGDWKRAGADGEAIAREAPARLEALRPLGRAVFTRWARRVLDGPS